MHQYLLMSMLSRILSKPRILKPYQTTVHLRRSHVPTNWQLVQLLHYPIRHSGTSFDFRCASLGPIYVLSGRLNNETVL